MNGPPCVVAPIGLRREIVVNMEANVARKLIANERDRAVIGCSECKINRVIDGASRHLPVLVVNVRADGANPIGRAHDGDIVFADRKRAAQQPHCIFGALTRNDWDH